MRNDREKGITLIALIITIIVMLILVAVTVNVALSGGLFGTAQDAAIRTEMEVIRERAENVKAALYANSVKDDNVKFDTKTYKEKLQEEFKGSELGLTKVIVENRKYDIIILDSDLNIEVRIHSDDDSFLAKTDIASGENVYNKYIEWNDGILAGVEVGTKQEILEGFLTFYINYTNVKENNGTVVHDNLEEWIRDEANRIGKEIIGSMFGIDMSEVTTKSEFYQKIIEISNNESEINITTEEQVAELFYNEFFGERAEKEICSKSWIAYVYKDGNIKDIKASIYGTDLNDSKEYIFKEKGNYEIVIKSITGQEVAREKIDGTNIIDNDYEFLLQNGDENWETDGKGTITKCNSDSSIVKVVIPYKIGDEKITQIGSNAFIGISATEVIIPNNINNIGDCAFKDSKLTEVTIPGSVENIGDGAFIGCNQLSKITIKDGVKNIGLGAFTMSDEYFPRHAKEYRVFIPASVDNMGFGAFTMTGAIIDVDEDNKKYSSEDGVLFNKDKTELIHYPALRSGTYTVPASVKIIKSYAFCKANEITEITIPSSVETIEDEAFVLCMTLSKIIMEEGIERIGDRAFAWCDSLENTNITIPNSVIYIGQDAFKIGFYNSYLYIKNIYFAPGDNPIPDGSPWGAEKANVEKLTN